MKQALGMVFAAIYLAALTWLVHREGERYRHDRRIRRSPAVEAVEQPKHVTPIPPPSVVSSPTPDLTPASNWAPDSPPQAETRAAVVSVEPKAQLDEQNHRAEPEKMLVDPDPPDLRRLAPEALRDVGQKLHQAIKTGHPLADEPARVQRLKSLARPLGEGVAPEAGALQFHILDSDGINAFSHLRDHIYVSRGVFALAQDDAELQFVVAHELAHLQRKHQSARLEQVARQAGARNGRIAWLNYVLALGHSDEQEFEADAGAYDALRRAGRSRREALGFLRRYAAYADEHLLSFGHGQPKSRPGDPRQDLENHFPAHPPAKERLARLEAHTSTAKKGRASAESPR